MPKYTRKIHFSFDESHLTHFGRMWLIQRFCQKLKLRYLIQKYTTAFPAGSFYHPSELTLALLFCIIMGLRRINKTDILQYNGAFLEMLGLKKFPDQATLRRLLKRLPPKAIRQFTRLHDGLRSHLFSLPRPRHGLIFDIDSSVFTIYGKAEGARVGYNPKKHGRRSYHPLFCFEARFEELWHGSLRPGDAASATGIIPFLNTCLTKVPSTISKCRIRYRMDSGFYGRRTVEFIDGTGCGCVIVAKEYAPLKIKAQSCRFKRLSNGWEVAEFRYQPPQWKEPHRYVVVRRPIPTDPIEAQTLTLVKDKKYAYHIFVTNLTTHPWRVWLFYAVRANIEKYIRELVYDYPLAKVPTADWMANVAFFQLVLFASNIVHWFRRLCLPLAWRFATLDSIRTDFLVLPAPLSKRGSENVVLLPHDYHYRKEFLQAFKIISKRRWPKKFQICQ